MDIDLTERTWVESWDKRERREMPIVRARTVTDIMKIELPVELSAVLIGHQHRKAG